MLEPVSVERRLEVVDIRQPNQYSKLDRWAVIVGISNYEYQDWNLRFADRDANELYQFLLTPIGGGFQPDHICKLTNEQATTRNITRALRSFLKKPKKEDLVLIYFACHGAPDLEKPKNVYLITHDTSPEDVAGTALPMHEIDFNLKNTLDAEKIIVLADTCHSGAIGGRIGRGGIYDNSKLVNQYLEQVSKAKNGIALFTSAQTNQVSEEHEKWGGGHGVFTHFILEGMKGAADIDQNNIVTADELFEYVRENVKRETDNRQCPLIGSNYFDGKLPLAILPDIKDSSKNRSFSITIAIGNYTNFNHWQSSKRAIKDARGVQQRLIDKFKFKQLFIEKLVDEGATKSRIISSFNSLRQELKPNDNLIIFFSGHIYTCIDKVGDKQQQTCFLVPMEAKDPKDCWSDCVELHSFLRMVAKLPPRHILVILNSCLHGASLEEVLLHDRDSTSSQDSKAQRLSRKVIISACQDEIALDGSPERGFSLFTEALLECFDSPKQEWIRQGFLTSSQLSQYLKERVYQISQSKQTPDYGDFYLDDQGEMVLPLPSSRLRPSENSREKMMDFLQKKRTIEYELRKLELRRELEEIEDFLGSQENF